jgi:DNA polymerase delta subunit 2
MSRLSLPYEAADSVYRVSGRKFEQQYAHIYFARLSLLSNAIRLRVEERWPKSVKRLGRVLEVAIGVESILVGTLFKEMKAKPSVLKNTQNDDRPSFCSETDHLILEDESGRVKLVLQDTALVQACATGVIAAIRGTQVANGEFHVTDVLFAGFAPQQQLSSVISRQGAPSSSFFTSSSPLLLLASGVNFSSSSVAAQVLVDIVSEMPNVVRVILAGNTFGSTAYASSSATASATATTSAASSSATGLNNALSNVSISSTSAKAVDALLAELCASVPVDLMPGAGDPANHLLPQQPIHPCLLPVSSAYANSLVLATNPHAFTIGGVQCVGTSGAPLRRLSKFVTGSPLEVLERCLEWRHLAPIAPDTLACYPFYDRDPFILHNTPHVLFSGDADAFATKLVDRDGITTRIICVPALEKQGVAVLLNLETLDCQPLHIQLQATIH